MEGKTAAASAASAEKTTAGGVYMENSLLTKTHQHQRLTPLNTPSTAVSVETAQTETVYGTKRDHTLKIPK